LDPNQFSIIPVIDIQAGRVVRAKAGDRASYLPIVTSLSVDASPVGVVEGLLRAWPARAVYIADLDAIQGRDPQNEVVRTVADRFPHLELWVDAGFATEEAIRRYDLPRTSRVVLGTESQRDRALLQRLGRAAILSLDSAGGTRLGPPDLHDDASLWPATVIVMTLARVGMNAGPDLRSLEEVVRRATGRAVIAAGGIRHLADCRSLQALGVSGALVASALHDGRIRRGQEEEEA
jgi:phosphoribosylformimino-5-aminoimidazole carboxamide ribotide isomerase